MSGWSGTHDCQGSKKHGTILNFVGKERLSQLTQTGRHQGVIAYAAAYDYAEIDDMLKLAERGEKIRF